MSAARFSDEASPYTQLSKAPLLQAASASSGGVDHKLLKISLYSKNMQLHANAREPRAKAAFAIANIVPVASGRTQRPRLTPTRVVADLHRGGWLLLLI